MDRKQMYDTMAKGWNGGKGETVCGPGSTREATKHTIEVLEQIVPQYNIKTVSDAGAGDLAWIGRVNWDVEYQAYDLIPRSPDVIELDITLDMLPKSDLILCRHVLNHLSSELVKEAMALFEQSGSKWLLMTNRDRQHKPNNWFPPLEQVFVDPNPLSNRKNWRLELRRLNT